MTKNESRILAITNREDRLKMIFMWVKQNYISFNEFQSLLKLVDRNCFAEMEDEIYCV